MGSKSAPPPDPAQQELARTQADVMRQQLEFDKSSYAEQMALARELMTKGDEQYQWQKGLAADAKARSDKYDALYDSTTGKQIRAFSDQVDAYDTSANRDKLAAGAVADVEGGLQTAKSNLTRTMAARGMNPGSAAYLSALADMDLEGGLARASAGTMAQEAARREGLQLRAQAAGLGSGLSGMASANLGAAGSLGMTSLGAAGTGLGATQSAVASFNQGQQVANQWGSSANSTYNSLWDQAYKRSQSGGGFGSFVGNVLGQGLGAYAKTYGGGFANSMIPKP